MTRRRRGRGFQYLDSSGATISERDERSRIESLAIPPAWTDVWICSSPTGHIQATGRGRRRALGRERVVATVVRLLDVTTIRVGNDEYARENRSFGLTTLRDRHVELNGNNIVFRFRGKGGKVHEVDIADPRVARVIKCEELPGQHLFQYLNDDGEPAEVTSDDVNDYLRSAAGDESTAKDFRTWTGTVLAAWTLDELGGPKAETKTKAQLVSAIESVAHELGNTPASPQEATVLSFLERRV